MFTPEEYLNAWLIYLLGAILMIACWWFLSRLIVWREVRHLSRVLVPVALLVPWYSDTGYDYLAPAIIISAVEGISRGGEAFWRAGTPLLVSLIVAVALSTAWSLWRWRRDQSAQPEVDA